MMINQWILGYFGVPYSQANLNGYMSCVEIPQVSLSLHGHHQVLPSMGCRGGGSLLKGLSAEYPRIKSDPSMIWLDVPMTIPIITKQKHGVSP